MTAQIGETLHFNGREHPGMLEGRLEEGSARLGAYQLRGFRQGGAEVSVVADQHAILVLAAGDVAHDMAYRHAPDCAIVLFG